MIWKIMFILAGWLYFVFEGLTESEISSYDPNRYHLRRVFENLGLIIAFHVLFVVGGILGWIWIFWLVTITGLCLYEFAFRKAKYGKYFAQKSGYWLSIRQPRVIFWKILFVVSSLILIIILIGG